MLKSNYYFTYDAEGHPFEGGWTRVVAESQNKAIEKFVEVHPRRNDVLTCCAIYTESQFQRTSMFLKGSNRGNGEWEVIE